MASFPARKTTGIFWIKQEDWDRYVSICVDGPKLPATYDEWLLGCDLTIQALAQEGWETIKVIVDLDGFVSWCALNALQINGHARTRYANEIVAMQLKAMDRNGQ